MKILVLCTGNSCRSQMAEGFLRASLGKEVTIYSAGLEPKGLNPKAVTVMKEAGVDISAQSSNNVDEYSKYSFDYVITVCDNAYANCPAFPGETTRVHWSIKDPAAATGSQEEIMAAFRSAREEISGRVDDWIGELQL